MIVIHGLWPRKPQYRKMETIRDRKNARRTSEDSRRGPRGGGGRDPKNAQNPSQKKTLQK